MKLWERRTEQGLVWFYRNFEGAHLIDPNAAYDQLFCPTLPHIVCIIQELNIHLYSNAGQPSILSYLRKHRNQFTEHGQITIPGHIYKRYDVKLLILYVMTRALAS